VSSVVITGAGSALGGHALRHLLETTTHDFVAVTSSRQSQGAFMHPRVRWLAANLKQAPGGALADALAGADRVLHFAWTRDGSQVAVQAANDTMIRGIVAALPDPSRFWLVSSVSGSPRAHSTYGRTKYASGQLTRSLGANVLVCGLVVEPEPERGPYRMLRNTLWKLPFALRAVGGGPHVYPLRQADLGRTLAAVCAVDLAPGFYRMYSDPVRFNAFVALIEALRPRTRLPLPFPAGLAVGSAALAKRLHVMPEKPCDQIMTFLYKDDAYLATHRKVPGLDLPPCDAVEFFHGSGR
jgi:nucleoside-diphosphate-sugar epimerase